MPMLYPVLEKEKDGSSNLSVLLIGECTDYKIVLFSYDYSDQHQVEFRFFNINDDRIELLGGGGGRADCHYPMSFAIHTGMGQSPEDSLSIVYGEVYDKKIESIEITYSDQQTTTVKVQNRGYLAIREMSADSISNISGLDDAGHIVAHLP